MTAKKPRKWFVNEVYARITLRMVNGWDEIHHRTTGKYYFDTWDEAYAHLKAQSEIRLKKAKAELPAAHRHIDRVAKLTRPTAQDATQ